VQSNTVNEVPILPTGASPLDSTGGLPFPKPLGYNPQNKIKNSVVATAHGEHNSHLSPLKREWKEIINGCIFRQTASAFGDFGQRSPTGASLLDPTGDFRPPNSLSYSPPPMKIPGEASACFMGCSILYCIRKSEVIRPRSLKTFRYAKAVI